jgi:hypothetical protein
MYLLYIFPPELHTWLRCSSFFNPSKKKSFGCAANRKSQRLISTPTYMHSHLPRMQTSGCDKLKRLGYQSRETCDTCCSYLDGVSTTINTSIIPTTQLCLKHHCRYKGNTPRYAFNRICIFERHNLGHCHTEDMFHKVWDKTLHGN